MNTDMNQYLIFRKCMGKTAQALKNFFLTSKLINVELLEDNFIEVEFLVL